MILIYTDSQIIDQEWIPRLRFNDQYTITHDVSEFIASTEPTKLAFTTHRLHVDWYSDHPAYQGFEDKINALSAASKYVFTFESELHNYHWRLFDACHHDNVYWVVPGQLNDHAINDNIIFWGDWFKTTSRTYKELPDKLNEIQPFVVKPKYFDALLGSPKPHRDFIANSVRENALGDKIIMTYGGAWNDNEFYAKDYFIWEPGTEIVEWQPGTAGPCRYYGVWTGLSRIIPIKVFNDTAYSIIAETDHDNTLSFFSEKTAKPMIARRLFVAFSGYKFLQNLHNQGFQTFSNVIDESYDLILDDNERYTAAFEQVKRLCSMDQTEVYNKIRDVVEHNFQSVMGQDWTQYSADKINGIIAQ
jgi:hypothetical protein